MKDKYRWSRRINTDENRVQEEILGREWYLERIDSCTLQRKMALNASRLIMMLSLAPHLFLSLFSLKH